MRNPLQATYRIQLRPEFTLNDAAGIVPYLKALGAGSLYTSPFLQATPGSTHGYDVTDYHQINEELGGQKALDRLIDALGRSTSEPDRGMGLVLDIVPNHMAIHSSNAWWDDVLKNGPSSRYAPYFDMEFKLPGECKETAILVPVLGDHYGRVLESGDIRVEYNGQDFTVRYFDNAYPVDPASLGAILGPAAERMRGSSNGNSNAEGAEELAYLAEGFDRLPDAMTSNVFQADLRYRDTKVLMDMLARLAKQRSGVLKAIREVIAAMNNDADVLDAFLSRQNYRLALWKISARELGYRRFFDINTMVGLRMENRMVYRDTHALVMDLVRRGVLTGLRVDHPDGLRDPEQYMDWLRKDAPDTWIVIEKILEPGERLPQTWPVQGTTGYDFLNRVNGLFVDPQGEAPLTEFYQEFTGRAIDYPALVHEKKLMAAKQLLGSDLNRLTDLFQQVCESHRLYRDYASVELSEALAEVAACLPVYRTYVTARSASMRNEEQGSSQVPASPVDTSLSSDPVYIDQAIEAAKNNRPDLDPRLFDFFRDLLLLKSPGRLEEGLVARFQQFTGPVMAKGVEDTSFYIYNRFVSLNEVSGDPERFGFPVDEFHQACQETQANWPLTMLATSTHDTKRSEDVRARLNVISELPGEWTAAVRRWAEINEKHRQGEYPERNVEYLLYQTLVGAWPISADRVVEYMLKAVREAKEITTWTLPNEAYERALEAFVRAILADSRFTADLETFVAEVLEPGRINALAQTLLKLTTPGVPDIYQGSEIWNLCLVDPDNRRPVDYRLRSRLLDSLADDTPPEKVLHHMVEGLPKLWVIRQALELRGEHPEWFGAESIYTPVEIEPLEAQPADFGRVDAVGEDEPENEDLLVAVTGDESPGIRLAVEKPAVAFLRGENLFVAVPRLVVRYRSDWNRFSVTLPPGNWRNRLTHEVVEGGKISLAELFARFPAVLLAREETYG